AAPKALHKRGCRLGDTNSRMAGASKIGVARVITAKPNAAPSVTPQPAAAGAWRGGRNEIRSPPQTIQATSGSITDSDQNDCVINVLCTKTTKPAALSELSARPQPN